MKLPAEYQAIIDAFKDTGNYSAEQSVRAAVERCYALHSKPPKELTDAEIDALKPDYWTDPIAEITFARNIITAYERKQQEPEKVKFRAARCKLTGRVDMLRVEVGIKDDPSWEWLEPEQSFEVVPS